MSRIHACILAAIGCLLAAMLLASAPAGATRQLKTGLAGVAGPWGFDHARSAEARILRQPVSWAAVAPSRPSNPRAPGDPAYRWGAIDQFVRSASKRGFKVLFNVTRAPNWAEGHGKKHAEYNGTWKPKASAFGDFAHALALRYSGGFRASDGALLPRVRDFEIWAEPNRTPNLEPQWQHRKAKSPAIYRRLLNAAYPEIKSVHHGNRVIGPGLAPFGDPRNHPAAGGARMRPLYFLRRLLCLRGRDKLKRAKHCPHPAKLDIVSHNPINGTGPPTHHAINPDDATSADLHRVMRVVHAAQRKHTIRPKHKHRKVWATEFWWQSKPPYRYGVPPWKQARWVEQGLYIFWKGGARVAIQQPLRDAARHSGRVISGFGGGLFYHSGKAKPSFRAFRFPFVTDRRSHGAIAWGKAPTGGKLKIQVKGHRGWRTVRRLRVHRNHVFRTRLGVRGRARLRAKVGSQKSLVWRQKR